VYKGLHEDSRQSIGPDRWQMSLIDAAPRSWTLDIAMHAEADTDLHWGGLRYTPCTIVFYA